MKDGDMMAIVSEAPLVGALVARVVARLSDSLAVPGEIDRDALLSAAIAMDQAGELMIHMLTDHAGFTLDELDAAIVKLEAEAEAEAKTVTHTHEGEADPMGSARREKAGNN